MIKPGFVTFVLVALCATLWSKYDEGNTTPVVQTSYGKLTGTVARSREGKTFYQFLGIPYASPPTGDLRYEPPKPPHNWNGIREMKKYGQLCLQVNSISRSVEGDEDCLYLNIFSPKFSDGHRKWNKPLLPVFVYIHGGYFMAGGSSYMGPMYLMNEDIVLVTINYRLNSFGFLNTGDGSVLGNMGLKDQVLALKYVQKEISNFGGDPKSVVIWGESAGAAAVHFHLLSPLTKGLFKKAIMSSGTAIKPWSLVNDPESQSRLFGRSVGCPTNHTKEMVECLKSLDSSVLIKHHMDALDSPIMNPLKIFAPSIEVENTREAFLTEHPYDILKEGRAHRIPVLTGVNSHEGLLATARIYFNETLAKQVERNWDTLSPTFFSYDTTLTNVTEKIKQFYFGRNSNLHFYDMFENFTNVFSDRWYIHSFKETIRIQSKYSPVYVYYFSHHLERGLTFFYDLTPNLPITVQIVYKVVIEWIQRLFLGKRPPYLGTCHGDDLVLLFHFPMVYIDVGNRDYELSRRMIQTWVQFAREGETLYFGTQAWPEYKESHKDKQNYMFFRNGQSELSVLIKEPFVDRMNFWDNLGLPWKSNS